MSADSGLSRYVEHWSPDDTATHDVIAPQRARELAVTLDLESGLVEGDLLPPLWQWVYFLDWVPTAALGVDGHPRDDSFLPPIPHRRRMFAGGRMTMISGLVVGEPAVRRSALAAQTVKAARSGELLFVTIRHDYYQHGELRVTEEQDLVYRSDVGASTAFSLVTESLGPPTTPWAEVPTISPMLLFRFSALTGNAHRIHYDQAYTTGVEGFPALVVHGPLLAIYLAELARAGESSPIKTIDFRLKRPVFLGDAIRVQGGPSADQRAELAVVSAGGSVHASAICTYR